MEEENNHADVSIETINHLPSLGKEFRDQRESRQISIDQAATDLHIDKRHLISIEKDDFATVGKPVFIRGYVTNYARYLELGQEVVLQLLEPYLAQFDSEIQKPQFLDSQKKSTEYLHYTKAQLNFKTAGTSKANRLFTICASVLILFILIGGGFSIYYVQFAGSDANQSVVMLDATANTTSSASNGQSDVSPLATIAEPVYDETQIVDLSRSPAIQPLMAVEPTELASEVLSANGNDLPQDSLAFIADTTSNQIPEVTLGTNQIYVENSQDSWIQITQIDGEVIVEQLYASNANPLFLVNLPVDMVIGNATSVSVTVNNRDFSFTPATTSNVAKFRISREYLAN